jgi:hypothetical protein
MSNTSYISKGDDSLKNKFPTLEQYEDELINTCEQHNGIPYLAITNVNFKFATHWIPRYDEDYIGYEDVANITLNEPYKLYMDRYDDDEPFIIDNMKYQTILYLAHEGDWIVLKGCKRWNDYLKFKWHEDYPKTEEYEIMIKSSMEFKKRAEREN